MKRTIAAFRSLGGYESFGEERIKKYSEDVRITEYVTVYFPDLDAKEYVSKQVAALKEKQSELQEKYLAAKAHIDDQISKLTSITHQPETVEMAEGEQEHD